MQTNTHTHMVKYKHLKMYKGNSSTVHKIWRQSYGSHNSFPVWPWLSWNSFYRSGSETHLPLPLHAGIKAMYHNGWPVQPAELYSCFLTYSLCLGMSRSTSRSYIDCDEARSRRVFFTGRGKASLCSLFSHKRPTYIHFWSIGSWSHDKNQRHLCKSFGSFESKLR